MPRGREEFLLKKSFGSELSKIPENARSAWEVKTFTKAKLRRDNTFHKCTRGPRDRLTRGSKEETFEDLENILSQKKAQAQEEERQ
jgi:hypothetical protein